MLDEKINSFTKYFLDYFMDSKLRFSFAALPSSVEKYGITLVKIMIGTC